MPSGSVVSRLRRLNVRPGLYVLITVVLLYTAAEGVWSGWSGWIPGSMSRHRDAQAVAITAVAYGKWQGYASYKSVNRTLREQGLSVQEQDLTKIGRTHYFEVMTDSKRLDTALRAASTLNAPESEGMFYAQDEKGMAALYTMSFAVFGISSRSWYWLYVLLYATSVFVACVAFRKRNDALLLILALVAAHAIVAQLLPALPRQDIAVINSNRFLGIMASVAMCHLMLLILLRNPPTIGQVAAAGFQMGVIALAVNARTSAAWIPMAIALLWTVLWPIWLLRRLAPDSQVSKPASWPMYVLVLGLAGLFAHQQLGLHAAFRDGRAQAGHVFWHSILTAVHNNPKRVERYGIPATYVVYDDQVSYLLFGREIARRGEQRSAYLVGDSDWVYRTNSPDLDFRWNAYDRVLRDVLWNTVRADPGYVMHSVLVQQPKSALTILLGRDFLRSRNLLCSVPLLALLLGGLLAVVGGSLWRLNYLPVLVCASLGVSLPVFSAAVVELRVVEAFYIMLLDLVVGAGIVVGLVKDRVAKKLSGNEATSSPAKLRRMSAR
jgi:hypothetical protein